MDLRPTPDAASLSDSKLPLAVSLEPEVVLKSAMLTLWEREVLVLFEHTANKVFYVYNAENRWTKITEDYRNQYYPMLERLVSLGERLLDAHGRVNEAAVGSDEERARFFDAVARPLCAEFAEILQRSRTFLPDMVEENVQRSLKGLLSGHEKGGQVLDSACREQWTESLEILMQIGHRICALGVLRESESTQVDLAGLCGRLAKAMPATGLREGGDSSSGVVVQAPSLLTEAVMMVLGREMLAVALEFRERLQRGLKGITAFDIGTSLLESRKHGSQTASLVTGGELLKVAYNTAGGLTFGIPVPREDFESLAWLKERVGQLVERWRNSVQQIGGILATHVADGAQAKEHEHEEDEHKEYRLSVQFELADVLADVSAPSHLLEEESYSVVDDEWFNLISSSLLQRTSAGRSYYMSVTPEMLRNGRLDCDSAILAAIESIMDVHGTLDSVRVQRTPLDIEVTQSSSEGYVEGAEEIFDEEEEEDPRDAGEASGHSVAQKGEYLFVFCADRLAIQQVNAQSFNSIQGTFRQLQAVTSMGLKAARAIPDRPLQLPPYTRIVLPESFLGNEDLMRSFLQLSSRCNVGEFAVIADVTRAKEYLMAAHRALDEYSVESEISDQLTLQLASTGFVRTPIGLVPDLAASLQIVSPTGAVLAEGSYSSTTGAFEMVTVPQVVMQPLTEAIVEALNEQLFGDAILRLVPLAHAIERRGFRIPDKLLVGLFFHIKALDGREIGVEMTDRVKVYLQSAFKQLKTQPPVIEGGMCTILSNDELPPAERA